MSHYLEHMLFMGSEKFPDENDYDSYLQHNGGAANAYTEMVPFFSRLSLCDALCETRLKLWQRTAWLSSAHVWGVQEYTNYYFDCNPAALHGALDRFSQFFVAPLCKADALEREVNAVENEFSGELLQSGKWLSLAATEGRGERGQSEVCCTFLGLSVCL